jgi:hypothetical protein
MILIEDGLDSFTLNLRDHTTKKVEKHCPIRPKSKNNQIKPQSYSK